MNYSIWLYYTSQVVKEGEIHWDTWVLNKKNIESSDLKFEIFDLNTKYFPYLGIFRRTFVFHQRRGSFLLMGLSVVSRAH